MTKRITKPELMEENHKLRQLLAREMADRAAVIERLNVLLAERSKTASTMTGYTTYTEAAAYAKQFGGCVRRDGTQRNMFIVVPKGVRAA